MHLTYLRNGETLRYDPTLCTGCRECVEVCPHAVFAMANGTAVVVDRRACMECGACMKNCAAGAIKVTAGVGCAAAVLQGMLRGTEPTCGCSGDSQLPVAAAKGSRSCCN